MHDLKREIKVKKTEQLSFWRSEFGIEYIKRNTDDAFAIRARVKLWSQILKNVAPEKINSILEVGSNIYPSPLENACI